MSTQGIKIQSFICPLAARSNRHAIGIQLGGCPPIFNNNPLYNNLQYNILIPRRLNLATCPPSPTNPGPYTLVQPVADHSFFAGPSKLSDVIGQSNPIVTDVALTRIGGSTPTATSDCSLTGNPYDVFIFHVFRRG